jgi:hypothetical protein
MLLRGFIRPTPWRLSASLMAPLTVMDLSLDYSTYRATLRGALCDRPRRDHLVLADAVLVHHAYTTAGRYGRVHSGTAKVKSPYLCGFVDCNEPK